MAPQTKKVQCTPSHEISLSDKLRPGLIGKIGNDTFLHTCTERVPSRSFPCLHVHIIGETVDDLRFVEQSAVKSGIGVWRLPETWCAWLPTSLQHRTNSGRDWTCSLVPALGGHLPKWEPSPSRTSRIPAPLVDIAAPPHRDPLTDLLHSSCHLRHSPFNEKSCD